MKGLIYKETTVFLKGIDKKVWLITGGAMLAILCCSDIASDTGVYFGVVVSILFAMTIGIQNIMCFSMDEKAGWKKYQLAMPVSAAAVVGAKYVSVVCTLAVSLAGSILFNLGASIMSRQFDLFVWGASAVVAVVIPLLWAAVNLPLVYWLGFRSAQFVGVMVVVPVFLFVKHFEEGAGFSAMTGSILTYAAVAGAAVAALFVLSMAISVAGCKRKR